MGIWLSRMLSYFGDQEARILVLGLDNAGKTTILCEYLVRATRHAITRAVRSQLPCRRPVAA